MNRYGLRAVIVALAVPVVVVAGYPASANSASWSISGCRLDKTGIYTELYGDVSVKNRDRQNEHLYTVTVQFNFKGQRLGVGTTSTGWIRPLESGTNLGNNRIVQGASASASTVRDGRVDCKITGVVDENNSSVGH